jgi:hypothetical protein
MDVRELEDDIIIDPRIMDNYRFDTGNPMPLLYQTGYLTIKEHRPISDMYVLGYPNEEVKFSFINELLPAFLPAFINKTTEFGFGLFLEDLLTHRVDKFMTRLQSFFAAIPYELNNKTEKDFQTVFYLLFSLIGSRIKVEESSAAGRSDAIVETNDSVYVFEFKILGNGTAEDALQQINDKGYATPYLSSGKKITKIGAEFSVETRTISRWVAE